MPKAKKHHVQKTSFCPRCRKRFANETHVLQHMNQPLSVCSTSIDDLPHLSVSQLPQTQVHLETPNPPDHSISNNQPLSPPKAPMELHSDDLDTSHGGQESDWWNPADIDATSAGNVKYYIGASASYPGGKTFMEQFFSDEHSELHKDNLFYPFASQEEWQIASWLLRSHLSMAAINEFLSLEMVSWFVQFSVGSYFQVSIVQIKRLPISFRTARELCLCTESLPSGPRWQSQVLHTQHLTRHTVMLFYHDPINCLQSLLSHLLLEPYISFVPKKFGQQLPDFHVYTTSG